MSRNIKQTRWLLLLWLAATTAAGGTPPGEPRAQTPTAAAQQQRGQIVVRGLVKGDDGEPIAGATVVVRGTTTGTTTDADGLFSIAVPGEEAVLVFSFIGFTTQEIAVGSQRDMKVTLADEARELDDIVVTAFGAGQRKETLVGSIQQVKPEALRVPSANITTAFAGRLAGVIATQSSGMPGSNGASFYIRGIATISGATSPLIVMDGMEISQDDLNHLDPDVIESFSILKDASATAMYGSRGANGVLIITTKSGSALERPQVSFRAEVNMTLPTSEAKFVDGPRFMELFNEAVRNQKSPSTLYTDEQIAATRAGANPYIFPNVDWRKEMFKDYSINQKANMNIRGGTNKIVYFMNVNVNHETGMLRDRSSEFFSFSNNIDYLRIAFQNNIDFNMSKSSKIALHLYAGLDKMHGPAVGENDVSGAMNSIYSSIMAANPVLFPLYLENPDGDDWIHWGFRSIGSGGNTNPFAQFVSGYQDSFASTITTNLNFDQKMDFLTEGLAFHAMFSFKNWTRTTLRRILGYNQYQLTSYEQGADGTYTYEQSAFGDPQKPVMSQNGANAGDRRIYAQAYVDYNRTFADDHAVSAMVLWNINHYRNNVHQTSVLASMPQRRVGLAFRATYGFRDRYLLEFNAGYNGSEQFATGHRWGFFPSVGAGYNISEEPFWEGIRHAVSHLKLRGTYGLVGNDQYGGERFIYREDVVATGKGSFTTGTPNGTQTASGPGWNRLRNEGITWEVGHKLDVGIDMRLWGDLSVTFDWFRERREKIFQQKLSIPNYLGTADTRIFGNLAEVENHGVDISVNYSKRITDDLSLQFMGTFTWNDNEVTKYDEAPREREALKRKGKHTNTVYGYVADGLYIDDADIRNSPTSTLGNIAIAPGDIKYLDQPDENGEYDGRIDANDRVPLGVSIPRIMYGFGPSVAWRGWDFSVFFQGRGDVAMFLSDLQPFGQATRRGVLQWVADNRWDPEHPDPDAKYPRLTEDFNNNNTAASTYYLRNGRFLKLKNAEVGYTWKKLRVYVNGTNLAVWSPFKMWDPEMGGGNINSKYPTMMTVNLGCTFQIN